MFVMFRMVATCFDRINLLNEDTLSFRLAVLRPLRLVRIFRLVRSLKRMRPLRELHKLATMMATCFRTLLWWGTWIDGSEPLSFFPP